MPHVCVICLDNITDSATITENICCNKIKYHVECYNNMKNSLSINCAIHRIKNYSYNMSQDIAEDEYDIFADIGAVRYRIYLLVYLGIYMASLLAIPYALYANC